MCTRLNYIVDHNLIVRSYSQENVDDHQERFSDNSSERTIMSALHLMAPYEGRMRAAFQYAQETGQTIKAKYRNDDNDVYNITITPVLTQSRNTEYIVKVKVIN